MKKWITPIVVLLLLIVCVITIPQTTVNYDMTKYLPDHSLTKQGLKILASEFGKESSIQVLVMDIEVNHLVELKQAILEVENIRSVIWLDDYVDVASVPISAIDSSILQEFYQEGDALLTIVFSQDGYDITLEERIRQIKSILEGYTIHLRGEVINNITSRNIASQEIIKIIFLILPVIIGLLILSGHSWIEPLLVLITLGIAVVFNVVTNGLYSQISFITQTMSLALQLALSIDYALFLIHRFYDEREGKDAVEASKSALKHSFKPITISALTTIAGFGALAIMNFTIGMDIALVLGKGILFSYLSTIFVLPVLLVAMDKWIIATKHRRFFPSFGFIAKIQRKIALPLVIILISLIGLGFVGQLQTTYLYSTSSASADDSVSSRDALIIEDRFGVHSQLVILLPNGDINQEIALVHSLELHPHVNGVVALVNQVDPTIPREYLPSSLVSYFVGTSHSRMIISVDLQEENAELYQFINEIKQIIGIEYENYYLVGEASAIVDIRDSVMSQNLLITVLTIFAVGSIVGIIFKSIKIPVILVATILGSIWINVSILAIQDIQVLYIGYLVVMSIQLGATIDYAVLFTHRYMEERVVKGKKDAFEEAFTKSSVSILISGSILTIVGFFEGFFSQIDSVKQIGYLLGSGAFISMLMILLLLPGALYYFDRWIIKKV